MATLIDAWLGQPAAQAIGWALLHFVWQGTIIGVLTAAALAALRNSAADVRYVVATIGLSLMVTLPAVTAVQMWSGTRASWTAAEGLRSCSEAGVREFGTADALARVNRTDPPRLDAAVAPRLAQPIASSASTLDRGRLDAWLPLLVFAWLCGVAVLTLRLMSGWVWVQRMRSHGTIAAGDRVQQIAVRLARRLHIARRIQLFESALVDVPTVIGWMKPVVLLPASALAGLTPHQLEAILAHELAHIRRHDYLVNLLQTLVETLLFYHPAIWWLSRRIRIERENCCDDLAVSLCGDPYTYAKALADLEELRGTRGQLVLAASGGSLVQRVRRLLAPTHAGRAPGWLAAGVAVAAMLGIGAGAMGTSAVQSPPATTAGVVSSSPQQPHPVESTIAGEAAVAASAPLDHGERDRHIEAMAIDAAHAEAAAGHAAHDQALAARHDAAVLQAAAFEDRVRAMALAADALHARAEDAAAIASSEMAAARTTALFALAQQGRASTATSMSLHGTVDDMGQSHGTFSWSMNGEKLEVKYDGDVEFTDDDLDVKRLSPGGLLRIKDGGDAASHTIEFKPDASGNITRRYWAGTSERPFEPEGRQWLAKMLPRFIRQTGIGAASRVARILKAKGPAGVLAEISLIEGSWAKKTYFTQLLKTAQLDPAAVRQVLAQAGREVDSDFELASLLIDNADKLLVDEGTRQAYFEAARGIDSDFEMRRVFSAALTRTPVSPSVLAGILDASRQIESDFEEASLLTQIAKLQPLDRTTSGPFFAALGTVGSDFEHRRVLSALAERTDLSPETTSAMLLSGGTVESDFEAASFLVQVAGRQPIEGALRAPFFRAVDSLGSAFERARVLQAVVSRADVSADTILAVLRAAGAMNASFETSQVLLAIASRHPLTGQARDAYIDASGKLGDFEQGKVLAALVRNERRRN